MVEDHVFAHVSDWYQNILLNCWTTFNAAYKCNHSMLPLESTQFKMTAIANGKNGFNSVTFIIHAVKFGVVVTESHLHHLL